jgi:hypothetical protein
VLQENGCTQSKKLDIYNYLDFLSFLNNLVWIQRRSARPGGPSALLKTTSN